MTFPAELERLLKEATEGPWHSDEEKIWRRPPSDLYERGGTVAGDKPIAVVQKGWYREDETGYPAEVNAALICLLVNHADAILGLVRAAELYSREPSIMNLQGLRQALAKLKEGK